MAVNGPYFTILICAIFICGFNNTYATAILSDSIGVESSVPALSSEPPGVPGDEKSCRLSVSSVQQARRFLNAEEIIDLTDGDIVDAPISTYSIGDKRVWVLPTARHMAGSLFVNHTFMVGDIGKPYSKVLGSVSQAKLFPKRPGNTMDGNGYKWITNIYKAGDEGLLAFIHLEYTGKNDHWHMECDPWIKKKVCSPGASRIGLAWADLSDDVEIPEFSYLGHIAGFTADRLHFNVHGTPFFVNEIDGTEYLNIVFHDSNVVDWGQITTARSPLSEVISAAKAGRTSAWRKFNKHAWTDALSGQSSTILPMVSSLSSEDPFIANGRVIVHSDAVYHRDTGLYVLSAYTMKRGNVSGKPSRLVFYDSCDGIHWRFNSIANERFDGEWGYSYLSFIDSLSDNGLAVGDFHLLAGFDYGMPNKNVTLFDVSIPESCTCLSGVRRD